MNIKQDYYWLNKDSKKFLERGYLKEGQTAQERVKEISSHAENILKIDGFAEKLESYIAKGYYSLATPVWTNFGNKRGLPISCFGSFIEDKMSSILFKSSEIGMMSKMGGGTSAYFGELRSRGSLISIGGTSSGPVHFMEIYDSVTRVVSQSSTRRGNVATYLPVEHPDILEFLDIRSDGHPIQDISIGVTITDEWMNSMIDGDKEKRSVWGKIIKKRYESGYPYIMFSDNANKNKPEVYKDKKRKITHSNLCTEIFLPDNYEESFVCCLSSKNLIHWEEWKSLDIVEDVVKTLIYFLDAVMQDFINKSKDILFMEHSYNFAIKHRALGAGVLGWHSLLQSKNVPFESMEAKFLNQEIFENIDKYSLKASQELAEKFGEPEILKGYGVRNTTRLSIAPTTSSSFILGQVSPSIEPQNSNYFVKKLAKGSFTYKNPYLENVLKEKDQNTPEIWISILHKGGSVQHLSFLSEKEKEVFKTFGEISQKEIVIQAAQRQKYIDQGQSLNIMVPPNIPAKQVSELLIDGWKMGIKSFYYQRSANPSQELSRSILECASCEG